MKGESTGQTSLNLNLTVHMDSDQFIYICHSLYEKGFAGVAENMIIFRVNSGTTRSQAKKQLKGNGHSWSGGSINQSRCSIVK